MAKRLITNTETSAHRHKIIFLWPSFPLASSLLLILSFGLLIPWLGFYFDDWPVILMAQLEGASGFREFYQYDRPFSAWTYILTVPLVGVSPLPWHIFTLFVRWLTVLGMVWCLRELWPGRAWQKAWSLAGIGLLFAIYPAFDQQPISVAYNQHWISYALYFLSLGAMIQSVQRPSRFWPFSLLSLASAALHLMTMEYFFGLELLRPLVLWILLRSKDIVSDRRSRSKLLRIGKVLQYWIPYLLLAIAYGLWRLFFLNLPSEDPNRPELLYDLFRDPLTALLQLLQFALRDLINILFGAWYRVIDPLQIDLSDRFGILSWTLAAVVSVSVAFFLMKFQGPKREEREANRSRNPEASTGELLWFGFAALLLGLLPLWLTGRHTLHGLYGGRFALAGIFGASVLWMGMVEALSDRRLASTVLVSVLVGLGVAFHTQNANDFRWYWQNQSRFYWQLFWRAPNLEPGTIVLSDGELFPYVGRYSTSAALNLLYPQPSEQEDFAYWFLELFPGLLRQHTGAPQDRELPVRFRSFTFRGKTDRAVVLSYEPESGRCLWVLSPQDGDNPELTELTRDSVVLSNLSLIQPAPDSPGYPPEAIFGREPEQGWCTFYQKAELARQLGEWDQAAQLGDEAQERGYGPNNVQEWLPFIEAYARTRQWEKALKWTRHVLRVNRDYAPRVCNLWERIAGEVQVPGDVEANLSELTERYDKCWDE